METFPYEIAGLNHKTPPPRNAKGFGKPQKRCDFQALEGVCPEESILTNTNMGKSS